MMPSKILVYLCTAVLIVRGQAARVQGQDGFHHQVCHQVYQVLQTCCSERREIHSKGNCATLLITVPGSYHLLWYPKPMDKMNIYSLNNIWAVFVYLGTTSSLNYFLSELSEYRWPKSLLVCISLNIWMMCVLLCSVARSTKCQVCMWWIPLSASHDISLVLIRMSLAQGSPRILSALFNSCSSVRWKKRYT